jgi:hypothetical protein
MKWMLEYDIYIHTICYSLLTLVCWTGPITTRPGAIVATWKHSDMGCCFVTHGRVAVQLSAFLVGKYIHTARGWNTSYWSKSVWNRKENYIHPLPNTIRVYLYSHILRVSTHLLWSWSVASLWHLKVNWSHGTVCIHVVCYIVLYLYTSYVTWCCVYICRMLHGTVCIYVECCIANCVYTLNAT